MSRVFFFSFLPFTEKCVTLRHKSNYNEGTLIYMEIGTGEEIDPNQIVEHRTDVAEEYNETFVETEELESLW